MTRKSARLRASGYYDTNEELDTNCPANISYRENPSKIFKKREGYRFITSRVADSATQSISPPPPIPAAQSHVSYPALVPYDTMRLNSRYLMHGSLPSRPPSVNSTSTTRSARTDNTIRSARTTRPYTIANSPSKNSSARSSGYMTEIRRVFFFQMMSLSLMADKAISMMMHVADLVNKSVSSRMRKTCGQLLLLFLIFLCVWLLFPMGYKLLLARPLQPNTQNDYDAKEINRNMKELIRLISGLADRIKAVEVKNEADVKPLSPSAINNQLTPELQQAIEMWLSDHIKDQDDKGSGRPMADKMADFALEIQGARVIASRCSKTYRGSREFVTLFGFKILTVSVSPRTVIQGLSPLLPGRCWSFPGAQGTLAITLSHPVRITHVTVDHLSRYNSPTGSINSAPKDFELYGMKDISEERTLLGTFTYNKNGESTQTFQLPNPTDDLWHSVEMHVLSNWGQAEYTCLYRFRVHGKIAST